MAEEELKKTILEKIQREKEALLSQARQEYEKLLNHAIGEASSLTENSLSQIRGACLLKKTKELSAVNLELKRQLLEAKARKVSEVFALVKEALKRVQEDRGRYKSIFKYLLEEALTHAVDKGAGLKLKVSPADKEPASEILKEIKVEAKVETSESVDGGLELCDSGESIIVLNTFASRLNKLMPELHQEISKVLFGE